MEDVYIKISSEMIYEVLNLLPINIFNKIQFSIRASKQFVFDAACNDAIRARYNCSNGGIILYGFTKNEICNFDYVDVLLHEIGHKIFVEMLCQTDRQYWINIRGSESFPIELLDIYVIEEIIVEEEFCIVFSLIYFEAFLRGRNMDKAADRVNKGLKKTSKRVEAVKLILNRIGAESSPRRFSGDCRQKIHERVRKFIFGDLSVPEPKGRK